ncbi:hypothetical protein C8J56DRAFT_189074 [Mycena floridula]|nr:hypothetical protein C8J56DRAFT_189074 [Mycena floridula]
MPATRSTRRSKRLAIKEEIKVEIKFTNEENFDNDLHYTSGSREDRDGNILRPRNSFMHFRSHFYSTFVRRGSKPKMDQNVLSINAGSMWRAMNDKERRPFVHLAAEEKRYYEITYPGYKYRPGGIKPNAKVPPTNSSFEALARTRRIRSDTILIKEESEADSPVESSDEPLVKAEFLSSEGAVPLEAEENAPMKKEYIDESPNFHFFHADETAVACSLYSF